MSERKMVYLDDAIRVASGYCHPANIAKELAKLPPAQPEFAKDTNVPSRCSESPNSSDMVIRQDAINAQERKK